MRSTTVMIILGCLLLVQGCKSPPSRTPPPTPPPSSSPSSSPPSSPSSPSRPTPPTSSPSSPSKPSPSNPSQSQQKKSSSQQSSSKQSSSKQSSSKQSPAKESSSKKSSSESQSSSESSSQQSSEQSSQQSSQQQQSGSEQPPSQQGESSQDRQQRTQAGTDLQAAGEDVASVADLLGDAQSQTANDGSTQPESDSNESGSEPEDPLIPKMEPTDSQSDELVFDESSANDQQVDGDSMQQGSEGQQNETMAQSQGDAAAGDEMMPGGDSGSMPNTSGNPADAKSDSGSGSDSMNDTAAQENADGGLSEDIAAAQEALEQAGIALQAAGEAVSGAETDAELQQAEDLLADARVGILIAEQALSDIDAQHSGDGSELRARANDALGDANVQLVIATQAVLNARTGMPDYEGTELPSGTQVVVVGELGTLDDELNESLIIFDDQIETARAIIINSSAPPISESTKNRLPGSKGQGLVLVTGDGPPDESPQTDGSAQPSVVTSTVPGNKDEQTVASATPDDIPSAQGDDIVAQQLREAAIDETDPELKAKLWEEYKRYKEGL